MAPPYRVHQHVELVDPVLVVALAGWIDAGAAAATSMNVIDAESGATPLVTFDPDIFLDYRARRPVMQLRDGINTELVWPETMLKVGRDPSGQDVLLLMGFEPDAQWHRFADAVAGLAVMHRVRLMVGLGAYPFGAPHSRPARLSISTTDEALARRVAYLRSSVDVPAGIEAVLEHRLRDVGVPAIGLWAQVPHYVANLAYPGATASLLAGLQEVAGLAVQADAVLSEAAAHRHQLDTLVANSAEHVAMVRQLEAAYDAEDATGGVPGAQGMQGPLPTGDEIAAELQRFLRREGGGPAQS